MEVNWIPPQPRGGLKGAWDRFAGPGMTRAEFYLCWAVALAAGIALPVAALAAGLGWGAGRLVIAGLIALDMAGGVVTNATSPAKRWYHREGQGFSKQFLFVAVHAFQLFLVAWLFGAMDWEYFGVVYGYLLVSALAVLLVPLYLKRPVALAAMAGAILVNWYAVTPPGGFEWFAPVLILKLLVSHLLPEAPFPPPGQAGTQDTAS